ncbi:unnamed protein product [Gordionus sp. m RMFG-2023]
MFSNILLFVYGIGFFIFGAYLRLHSPIYTDLSGEEMSTGISFLLMVMTITFCTAALIGVKAYLENSPDSFKNYYVVLTTIVFSQILIILFLLAFANKIKNLIGRDLGIIIKEKYGKFNEKSVGNSIDFIQNKYQCCGATDYQDYADSFFLWTLPERERLDGKLLPRSCCVNPNDVDCNKVTFIRNLNNIYWEVGSNFIFTKGCLNQLQNTFVDENLPYLVGNFIAIFILQILAIYFAFSMESKLYDEMGSKIIQSQEMAAMDNQIQPPSTTDKKTILTQMTPFDIRVSTMAAANKALAANIGSTPSAPSQPMILNASMIKTSSSLLPNQNNTLPQPSAAPTISTPITFENVPLTKIITINNESKLSPHKQTLPGVKETLGLPTISENLSRESVYITPSLVQKLEEKPANIQNEASNKLVESKDEKPKLAKTFFDKDDDHFYLRDIS